MPIDTRPARLAALRTQAERLPPWEQDAVLDAFEVADAFAESVDAIRSERYSAERETEELRAARATAIAGFGEVFAAVDNAVDAERERVVDGWDGERNTRVRENRRLADVIDVDALTNADSAATVRGLVETASAFGLDAEARQMALRVVRPKAADEQRKGRLNGPWFSALCWLSETRATPSARHEIGQRVGLRRAALRGLVKQIADVVGVGNEVARTAQEQPPAPVPDNAKSTMTVGRFWDDNPQFRR